MDTQSVLGFNGLEYPHWSLEQIADFAVRLKAGFVELAARRIAAEGADAVLRAFCARDIGLAVNCFTSELGTGLELARRIGAGYVVLQDDSIESPTASRPASLEAFRQTALGLLEAPTAEGIQVALENGALRITRDPEDVLAVVTAVNHPAFGVNYDPDNYYNAGVEGFPYAYELLRGHILYVHAKDSGRYLSSVHGVGRRVLHRAGGNVVCLPLGTGAINWTGLAARLRQDGYRGPVSLEPHNLPDEMAPSMERDAAFLRQIGLVG